MACPSSPSPTIPTVAMRASAVSAGREVARVHRILQIIVRLVGPELRHVGERVDDRVLQTVAHLLDLAYVNVLDRVAEVVEANRPPRRVGQVGLAKRGQGLVDG